MVDRLEKRIGVGGVLAIFKGTLALGVIAANTVLVCLFLYPVGIVRWALPDSRVKRALGLPMDWMIDVWVFVMRGVIRGLGISDLRIEMPPDLNGAQTWNLVISNHQSWADIVVLQSAFFMRIPRLKFFTKRQLLWMPVVGLAMWFLGFPYVYRLTPEQLKAHPEWRGRDRQATLQQCRRFLERPVSALIFVEGTRFTETKRQNTQSPYRNLLKPRPGGMQFVLESLEDKIQRILDVTIQYEGQVPGFWDFLCGKCSCVRLSAELRSVPDARRKAIETWLESVWAQKDEAISGTQRAALLGSNPSETGSVARPE